MEQLIEEEIAGDAYIIDKIIDVERLKTILRELLEHGKTIGKATLEQLMKIANGAAKGLYNFFSNDYSAMFVHLGRNVGQAYRKFKQKRSGKHLCSWHHC